MTNCLVCDKVVEKIPGEYWRYVPETSEDSDMLHNNCVQALIAGMDELREILVKKEKPVDFIGPVEKDED